MAKSPPAPGDLELVRAFVNTRDVDEGSDEFDRPDRLASWLGEHGLVPASPPAASEDDRELAVTLREALRTLMLANNDARPVDAETLDRLREVARRTAIAVDVDALGRVQVTPAGEGVRSALSSLLLIVERAMADGTWQRLKACRDDTCQWSFYDHSKNRSRAWCSMEVCGSRNKAREYRRRRSGHDESGHDRSGHDPHEAGHDGHEDRTRASSG